MVVSGDQRFKKPSLLQLTKDAVPCLLEATRVEEARAAASANGGTTPKYLVTVYARRAGEDGPPVPFQAVPLTPSPAGHGTMSWYLSGLGPLHQHLGLAPRSPVRLVREVGQDGRVRLVVEPREEGEGAAGGGGEGKGKSKGKRPAMRVDPDDSDTEAEDEHGVMLQIGHTSCGSEEEDGGFGPARGSDEEESSNEGGTSSEGPDWVPGEGAEQGARVGRAQQQQQQEEPKPQRQPQPRPEPPQLKQSRQRRQQQTKPGDSDVGGDGAGPSGAVGSGEGEGRLGRAWGMPGGGEEGRPDERRLLEIRMEQPPGPPQSKLQPQPQQQQPGPGGGGGGSGGDGAGPSGAAVPGAGVAEVGPGVGHEGRPGKRQRLEIRTERTEERPAAGKDGEVVQGAGNATSCSDVLRRWTISTVGFSRTCCTGATVIQELQKQLLLTVANTTSCKQMSCILCQ